MVLESRQRHSSSFSKPFSGALNTELLILNTQKVYDGSAHRASEVLPMTSADDEKAGEETSDDILSQARQLLELTAIVDKYPQVVSRRVSGIIYVLIGGAISFSGLLFIGIAGQIGVLGSSLWVNLLFIGVNLFIAWAISFRLVVPLMKSYPRPEGEAPEMSREMKVSWIIIVILIIVTSMLTFGTEHPELFSSCLQALLFFGNIVNYREAKRDPVSSSTAKESVYYAVAILMSIIPIVIFPGVAFYILILVDIGGIFFLGIYMLITAERLLLESVGREK